MVLRNVVKIQMPNPTDMFVSTVYHHNYIIIISISMWLWLQWPLMTGTKYNNYVARGTRLMVSLLVFFLEIEFEIAWKCVLTGDMILCLSGSCS